MCGWEWNYLTRQFDRNAILLRPPFGPGRIGRGATYLTPDSKRLLALTEHPLGLLIETWDTATGKKVGEKELPLPAITDRLSRWYTISPDRQLVAVWEPPSNFFRARGVSVDPVVPMHVPASAQAVQIYDLNTGNQVSELRGHTSWVYHVLFCNDSKQVVTGGSDRTIRFWGTDGSPGMVLKGAYEGCGNPARDYP